ncbi:MAG: hypothetical protein ACLR1D_05550 [Dialister sp.]
MKLELLNSGVSFGNKAPTANLYVYCRHDKNKPENIVPAVSLIIDKFTVKSGEGTGLVHVRTDPTGIDLKNEEQLSKVLGALAKKLVYTDYVNGKRDIKGTVGIAEGILTPSFTKVITEKNISFDSQGRGMYRSQNKKDFTSSLTGGEDKPYADAFVKSDLDYIQRTTAVFPLQVTWSKRPSISREIKRCRWTVLWLSSLTDVDGSKNTEGKDGGILVKNGGLSFITKADWTSPSKA